ncbi:sigma-70 family RNA polymerase sigma factor [Micromonospora fulviviridis]|uniref:Sigma-70 family RNA polymerase sigma factor n=1 Tax=Micromonospora fulviviridis TaxID=47860 RepID=A0ABV2VYC6_9ACTN
MRNLISSEFRAAGRSRIGLRPWAVTGTRRGMADDTRTSAEDVWEAVADLPDHLRDVLVAVHLRRQPIDEVAELFAVNPDTIKSWTYHALRLLREALVARGSIPAVAGSASHPAAPAAGGRRKPHAA